MADDNDPWVDKDFEAAVRDTAYFLWENDGRPFGREKEYWFAALDKCLRQRHADALLRRGLDGGERPADDNIDDLGRPVNNPRGKRLEQPLDNDDAVRK
ncbi:hypothetical protein FF80_02438 [Devosia sp. LC5]|uniref:DUF2934 domain-containing protein n=1 Tax=Devosia sp. LC5 TaxID=1502724 RepID=UPI0004E4227B|nr:DUF2934 domain-containing protein [Devosia sp. LC5]KFC66671.1 hypothetical protein FF80_02438 [Devosia sp. LC5]